MATKQYNAVITPRHISQACLQTLCCARCCHEVSTCCEVFLRSGSLFYLQLSVETRDWVPFDAAIFALNCSYGMSFEESPVSGTT